MLVRGLTTSFYNKRRKHLNLICGQSAEVGKLNREVHNSSHCALKSAAFSLKGWIMTPYHLQNFPFFEGNLLPLPSK
jgi:hypothetical protein